MSIPSLLLLLGSVRSKVAVPIRVPSMGQIDLTEFNGMLDHRGLLPLG